MTTNTATNNTTEINPKYVKIAQSIIDEYIGGLDNAIQDGYEITPISYRDMVAYTYNEIMNNHVIAQGWKNGRLMGAKIPEGVRFQGKQYVWGIAWAGVCASVMEWGAPMCHDGTDTLADCMIMGDQ